MEPRRRAHFWLDRSGSSAPPPSLAPGGWTPRSGWKANTCPAEAELSRATNPLPEEGRYGDRGEPIDGPPAGYRGEHLRCHGHPDGPHGTEKAGRPAPPSPEDGGRGAVGGWHRPRLQQPAHDHHRLHGDPAR